MAAAGRSARSMRALPPPATPARQPSDRAETKEGGSEFRTPGSRKLKTGLSTRRKPESSAGMEHSQSEALALGNPTSLRWTQSGNDVPALFDE